MVLGSWSARGRQYLEEEAFGGGKGALLGTRKADGDTLKGPGLKSFVPRDDN